MVFSRRTDDEFERALEFGRAVVVPCSRPVRSATDLVEEAVCLWTAETSDGKNPRRRISAKKRWGRVALLENQKHPIKADLRAGWTEKVSNDDDYGSTAGADVPVDTSGFLTIPWPESEDLGVDIMLATATDPKIDDDGHYPSTKEIAEAWSSCLGRKHVDYFCKNRAHGIKTFQDETIEAHLRELWH